MLIKASTLKGFKLNCLDGEIGKVKQFYFDDQFWTIRYMVAETGNWLFGRQVLVSPFALASVASADENIAVNLTRQQIEDSPSLESDKPVSRRFEEAYSRHFGWPPYWEGPSTWGSDAHLARKSRENKIECAHDSKEWDLHLRSTQDVSGHHVQAEDGEIGHVDDFVIDDETWAIRYLVINTSNWWQGKKVLISPRWIQRVSWNESKVFLNLSREAIKQAPEYSDQELLDRDYESKLHLHYNLHGYWLDEMAHVKSASK